MVAYLLFRLLNDGYIAGEVASTPSTHSPAIFILNDIFQSNILHNNTIFSISIIHVYHFNIFEPKICASHTRTVPINHKEQQGRAHQAYIFQMQQSPSWQRIKATELQNVSEWKKFRDLIKKCNKARIAYVSSDT